MCSGRVDLEFIFRAFANGQDGVFIGGCRLNECNYITQGNYDALGNALLSRKIMAHIGMHPERLKIAFMSSSDGALLADEINAFTRQVKELGPLARDEGIDEKELRFRIDAVRKLVPYIRLAERERMRIPEKSEAAYRAFFGSADFDALFEELIGARLAQSRIMALLKEGPRATAELSEMLGMNPSDISRRMNGASRQGWVRYDTEHKRYALA